MPPTPKPATLSMRQTRLHHELSLREVARTMGISAPYLLDLELGRRTLSPRMAGAFFSAISRLSKSHR
jgi:transcriptional regulator with XRE-family HTH domain